MDAIIETVETEINKLNERGLLRWYDESAAEHILFDYIDLYYECMITNTQNSILHAFELMGKHFFYLVHCDDNGNEEFCQFLWDCERRLIDIVEDL